MLLRNFCFKNTWCCSNDPDPEMQTWYHSQRIYWNPGGFWQNFPYLSISAVITNKIYVACIFQWIWNVETLIEDSCICLFSSPGEYLDFGLMRICTTAEAIAVRRTTMTLWLPRKILCSKGWRHGPSWCETWGEVSFMQADTKSGSVTLGVHTKGS